MKVVKSDNETVLRDIPWTNWTYGVLGLLGAVLFGVPSIKNTVNQRIDIWQILGFFIAAAALYWAYEKFSSPIIITHIKITERIVAVTEIRFLLLKKTRQVSFSQIKHAEMVGRKPDRAFLYYSVLILRDGSLIDLESSGNITDGINRIPSLINDVLKNASDRKQKRGSRTKAQLTDEYKPKMR